MLILRSCAEICQKKEKRRGKSKWKKAPRFQVCPCPALRALPNGVNICANSIKWIYSYACDLHFVAEITLSHAQVVGAGVKGQVEWQLYSLRDCGKILQLLLIFFFRINFYDFRTKLPQLSLACKISFLLGENYARLKGRAEGGGAPVSNFPFAACVTR